MWTNDVNEMNYYYSRLQEAASVSITTLSSVMEITSFQPDSGLLSFLGQIQAVKMIINTGGSRVIRRDRNEVRRRTLLEVAKGDDTDNNTSEPTTRRRAVSDVEPMVSTKSKDIKMKEIETRKKESRENQRKPIVRHRDIPSKMKGGSLKTPGLDFQTAWINIVSERDVNEITSTQRQTLRKFEETNEMLRHFNLLSESTFIELQKQYQSHVQLLSSLKSDLEQIFRRLRSLKEKMKEKYPEAVQATIETVKMLKERQMMEMEYEVQKHMDERNGPAEILPSYYSNPDAFMCSESISEDHERLSTSELEHNLGVAEYREKQLAQNDSQQENEHEELEFVAKTDSTVDFIARSETECSRNIKIKAIGSQEGNAQLNANIASAVEDVEVNETKGDLTSNSEILSEKLNELDIRAEGSRQKEMLYEGITNSSQSNDLSQDIRMPYQKDTQNMAFVQEQRFDCDVSIVNDSVNPHNSEANTVNMFEGEKEENLIN